MTAGKWSVTRYENGLWCIWDGDGHHRGSYSTWEAAMRDAYRVAAILDRVGDALTKIDTAYQSASDRWEDDVTDFYAGTRADALSEAHHLIYEALGDTP